MRHDEGNFPSFQVLLMKAKSFRFATGPMLAIISLCILSGPGAFFGADFLMAVLSSLRVKSFSKGRLLLEGELCFCLKSFHKALSRFLLLVDLLTLARNLLKMSAFFLPLITFCPSWLKGFGFSFFLVPSKLLRSFQVLWPCLFRSSCSQVSCHLFLLPVLVRYLTFAVSLL